MLALLQEAYLEVLKSQCKRNRSTELLKEYIPLEKTTRQLKLMALLARSARPKSEKSGFCLVSIQTSALIATRTKKTTSTYAVIAMKRQVNTCKYMLDSECVELI